NKAIELTSNIESNIADISRILSTDQSLATRVLRLSNSPLCVLIDGRAPFQESGEFSPAIRVGP
ncbi:MAG: HDOD domain-containing protein, partial [Desulfobacterales bacterium]|nr:HDOD domain-containing protein [Desulfobacterales bacterium]